MNQFSTDALQAILWTSVCTDQQTEDYSEKLAEVLSGGDAPLPSEARELLKTILTKLHKSCPSRLEGFAQVCLKRCLYLLDNADLRKSLFETTSEFCRRRGAKGDFNAILSAHLKLTDLIFGTTPPTGCLDFYIYLYRVFKNDDDADFDVFWREAVEYSTRVFGPDHRETADSLDFLAHWLAIYGDCAGSCDVLAQAIKIWERSPEFEDELGDDLVALAENALIAGLGSRAVDAVARARVFLLNKNRSESKESARLYAAIAKQHAHDEEDSKAIENFKRALSIFEKVKDPLRHYRALVWLARIYSKRKEPGLTEDCYERAVALHSEISGTFADEVADNLYVIAGFYSSRGELDRAEAILENALALKKQAGKHKYTAIDVIEKELALVRRLKKKNEQKPQLPALLGELEEMVGLQEVKKTLREHGVYMDFLRLRKERGFDANEKPVLHAVFTGNPGTGKTTVAKLLGQIYHRLGLLSKGDVHAVVRADLVGTVYGSGEKLASDAIAKAAGGVLFIDEAYNLATHYHDGSVDTRDPGQQAIETLLPVLSDPDSDIAVVVAGYPQEMEVFLHSNPGLRSRFKLHIRFDDYTPPEMLEIAVKQSHRQGFSLADEAQDMLLRELEKAYQTRNKSFGNARFVHSLLDDCKHALGTRIMSNRDPDAPVTDEELSLITVQDVGTALSACQSVTYRAPINERELEQVLAELHALVGLKNVKTFISELVKVVRLYRELGKDVLSEFKLHLVFTGNPGTGKTTVARLLAKIYRALGILERGHLVECDRSALVGQWLGQTEENTKQKIEEALGGVLFIDEAYALAAGGTNNDFGPRVIEVLLKEMEDKRGQFFAVLAGYKDEMESLLESNPGLRSRIDRNINFENCTMEEMEEIATKMLKHQGLTLSADAEKVLREKLKSIAKSKGFANARSVRAFVEILVLKHFARLADVPAQTRTAEMLYTIEADLLKQVEAIEAVKPLVGF